MAFDARSLRGNSTGVAPVGTVRTNRDWRYATKDSLMQVLAPGYFAGEGFLVGDCIRAVADHGVVPQVVDLVVTALAPLQVAAVPVPAPAPAPGALGFRSNPPATELAAAEAWLGRPLGHLLCFLDDPASWTANLAKAKEELPAAAAAGRPAEFVLGLNVSGTSLAQVAAGEVDAYFRQLAWLIVQHYPAGLLRVRLGWEMNGDWYPWSARGVEANYIAAFRRVVGLFRTVSERFKFAWVCNMTLAGWDPSTMYPGDAYVDYVGMNAYLVKRLDIDTDAGASLDLKILNATDWKFSSTYGFDWLATFASARGKPICIAEWGTNSEGTQYYVSRVAKYIRDNNVVYHGYWDQNNTWGNVGGTGSDYWDKVSNNQYPAVSGEFSKEFGPLLILTPAAHAAGRDTATYIPLVANREVAYWTALDPLPAGITILGQTLVVAPSSAGGTFRVVAVDTALNSTIATMKVTMQATVPAWTPAALGAALDAWIDVADAATLTTGGGTCSAVADKSGKGHGLSQGTAGARPAYGVAARNGKPGLTFDGVDDVMSFTAPLSLAAAGSAGAVALAGYIDATANAGTKALYGFADSASGHIERCSVITSAGVTTLRLGHTNLINNTKKSPAGLDVVLVSIWPGTPSAGGLQPLSSWLQGERIPTVVSIASTAVISEGRVGARPVGANSTDFAPVILQEIVKVTRELTPYEAVVFSGYLAWKWGTQGLLRQDHPMKLGAPKLTA